MNYLPSSRRRALRYIRGIWAWALSALHELELELAQPQMAQKPMLRGEVGAHVRRVCDQTRKDVWALFMGGRDLRPNYSCKRTRPTTPRRARLYAPPADPSLFPPDCASRNARAPTSPRSIGLGVIWIVLVRVLVRLGRPVPPGRYRAPNPLLICATPESPLALFTSGLFISGLFF